MKIYLAGANLNTLDRKFENVYQEKGGKILERSF